jgi:hypothetical protein
MVTTNNEYADIEALAKVLADKIQIAVERADQTEEAANRQSLQLAEIYLQSLKPFLKYVEEVRRDKPEIRGIHLAGLNCYIRRDGSFYFLGVGHMVQGPSIETPFWVQDEPEREFPGLGEFKEWYCSWDEKGDEFFYFWLLNNLQQQLKRARQIRQERDQALLEREEAGNKLLAEVFNRS